MVDHIFGKGRNDSQIPAPHCNPLNLQITIHKYDYYSFVYVLFIGIMPYAFNMLIVFLF